MVRGRDDDSEYSATLGAEPFETTVEASADAAPDGARPRLLRVFTPGSERVRRYDLEDGVTLIGRSAPAQIPLKDARSSRLHASITRDGDTLTLENLSKKNGTFVAGKRVESVTLPDGACIRMGDSVFVLRREHDEEEDDDVPELVGASRAARALRRQVALVARADAWVVLLGETGTGKEVTATAIHRLSERPGDLVSVNCAAVPESIAESQFFGHKKGAFSGAERDADGHFHHADGGTLFLDEVGELPLPLQPKLLRALDARMVARLGERRPRRVDLRIVSATNRALSLDVKRGAFRADLYARLADVTVVLPPLRERREDVLLLLRHFLEGDDRPLEPDLAAALVTHPWPMNVRELQKTATELRVRAQGESSFRLDMVDARLADAVEPTSPTDASPSPDPAAPTSAPAPPGRDELAALLREHTGNVVAVARAVGRSRKQVYRWLRKHDLSADDFRG